MNDQPTLTTRQFLSDFAFVCVAALGIGTLVGGLAAAVIMLVNASA